MKVESLVSGSFKALGPRFNLVGLLPGAVLVLFLLALHVSGAPAEAPNPAALLDRAQGLETKESLALVVAVLVMALMFQPLQLSLVRLLEGYWGSSWLAEKATVLGVALERRRRAALAQAAELATAADGAGPNERARMALAAWRLRQWFPPQDKLLPTRLGNALRAAEDRAGRRYGLDAVVVWPRLYPLVRANLAAVLVDQRDQLDLAARFSVAFFVMAAAGAAVLYRYPAWLAVPGGALVLSWLSYRSAVAAAIAYGETIEATFDHHRFDLLKALHLPLPADRESERLANQRLCDFLRQGIPVPFIYRHPGEDVGKTGESEGGHQSEKKAGDDDERDEEDEESEK
jgi:hypothetical protein